MQAALIMLFNSLNFLIFFPVVTTIYFILPQKFRWLLLLLASCYFYMSFVPVFILILAFTITVDYFAGIYIEAAVGKRRKQLLIVSIIANVGVLFIFKYFNFANQNIAELAHFLEKNGCEALETDLGERHNVARQHADRVAEMTAQLEQLKEAGRSR